MVLLLLRKLYRLFLVWLFKVSLANKCFKKFLFSLVVARVISLISGGSRSGVWGEAK